MLKINKNELLFCKYIENKSTGINRSVPLRITDSTKYSQQTTLTTKQK